MDTPIVQPTAPFDLEQVLALLERADAIASTTALDELLRAMLELLVEIAAAQAGTLYLVDGEELVFSVMQGEVASQALLGTRIPKAAGIAGATAREGRSFWVDDIHADERWDRRLINDSPPQFRSVLSLPLLLQQQVVGVIQVFNPERPEPRLLQLLGNRMASEVEKARLLKQAYRRESRMSALIEIIGQIGSTLDRHQLLNMIMEYGRTLLGAEASSLFLVEPATGDLVLHVSTGPLHDRVQAMRIPKGKGIAGYVTESGETVLVTDVSQDSRHYATADRTSGFTTRSILAVPLRTRGITLGQEREATAAYNIGCIEALNKIEGTFAQDDVLLFQTLARQAATVLEIATLYADVNELFFDVIQALTAAIDAKDPYTEGHSQRVSEFSVAVAEELALAQDFIHHLRIGAILHDVGKIGVSDQVLKKPGHLTREEFAEMKLHPTIGERILGHIRLLESEMPALIEHHERLDGSGYPKGLSGEAISLAGRIVAVADAFDAMTSDRPYRAGMPVEEAFRRLRAGAGTEFDDSCVEALYNAFQRGAVRPQRERGKNSAA